MKTTISPELLQKAAEKQQRQKIEDAAGLQAATEPLPGPAREAFTLEPSQQVGPYQVRAACDFDLNLLSQLNSKFYALFMSGGAADELPSGPDTWDLCWIMTRPAREVAAFIKEQKLAGLKESAKDEFAFMPVRDLAALVIPCIRQIVASCTTVIGHEAPGGPEKTPEEMEAAKANANPPLSGQPLTG